MAVSRAAVLQSLVLDDSLRQYQSAAVNSVQSLASSFTGIAHALQKQKVQATYAEQTFTKQINETMSMVNSHDLQIIDLKQHVDHTIEKWNKKVTLRIVFECTFSTCYSVYILQLLFLLAYLLHS
jgi:hypothetical protein